MNNRKAFTLIEILIVLAIIALLVGILLPSITMIRKQAKETAQKAQFGAIDMALDAFKQDYGDYPPWGRNDGSPAPQPYCGTQKLTEALLGMDLRGFHPQSTWRRDGYDAAGVVDLYGDATLNERRGPYLEVAKTGVFHLDAKSAGANDGLYIPANIPFFGNFFDRSRPNYVICDVFAVKKISIITQLLPPASGSVTITKWAGSPILYFKANTNSKIFIANPPPPAPPIESIYDIGDNMGIFQLGKLPDGYTVANPNYHRLIDPTLPPIFYNPGYKIADEKVPPTPAGTYWPNRPDTYILISAGADHEFGTKDDILNF